MYNCPHWLRPRPPPLSPHLGSYTRTLLVSQDRRHLCVTPCEQYLISLTKRCHDWTGCVNSLAADFWHRDSAIFLKIPPVHHRSVWKNRYSKVAVGQKIILIVHSECFCEDKETVPTLSLVSYGVKRGRHLFDWPVSLTPARRKRARNNEFCKRIK